MFLADVVVVVVASTDIHYNWGKKEVLENYIHTHNSQQAGSLP